MRAKKSQKKGLKFTVMVCGPGGSGKSTFINTLCGRDVISELDRKIIDPAEAHKDREMELVTVTEDLPDDLNGVLSLRLLDTPGFGDALDNQEMMKYLSNYVDSAFDEVLAEESRIRRNRKFTDNRVHALVYFIVPTGHGLRELDIEFMKLMGTRVNIIPVIGKADSMTQDELLENKRLVMADIDHHNIPVYQFPSDSDEEDSDEEEDEEEEKTQQQMKRRSKVINNTDADNFNQSLRSMLPFAIIGGTELVTLNGRPTLARQYPWGAVAVDDPKASDFATLRDVLLATHLYDLKETTHDYLYESYRTEKLSRDIHPSENNAAADSTVDSSHTNTGGNVGLGVSSPIPGSPAPDTNSTTTNDQNASYVVREEHLRKEEEKLKSIEMRVQEEISRKRQEMAERERELRSLEQRLKQEELDIERTNSPSISSTKGFNNNMSTDSLSGRFNSTNSVHATE